MAETFNRYGRIMPCCRGFIQTCGMLRDDDASSVGVGGANEGRKYSD